MNNSKYPIVMIGGPPNSGKSVLVRAISEQLRKHDKGHYVLRAAPDGEGDWTNSISEKQAKALRHKGKFTPHFINRLEEYLSHPVFPLLVDVGGRPTAEQASIFRYCTHAILLVGYPGRYLLGKDLDETYETAHKQWLEILETQQIPLIADLKSQLVGEEESEVVDGCLKGTIVNLDRNKKIKSQTLDTLIKHLGSIVTMSSEELADQLIRKAPVETGIDLERLFVTMFETSDKFWRPQDLIPLRKYLPEGVPLAIYGRAPVWVYATLADLTYPAEAHLFDARLGWINIPEITQMPLGQIQGSEVQTGWGVLLFPYLSYQVLHIETESQYLDVNDMAYLPIPEIESGAQLILSGKVPNWLWMGIVKQLRAKVQSIAVYQPQINSAVVVATQNVDLSISTKIPLDGEDLGKRIKKAKIEASQKV